MRILQVISAISSELGGPSNAVLSLSRELIRQGHQVIIFTTDFSSNKNRLRVPLKKPILLNGVPVVFFPCNFFSNYKVSFSLAKAIKKCIAFFDLFYIHSLFQFASHVACFFCQLYKKPYILRPLGQLDPKLILKKSALFKFLDLLFIDIKNLKLAAFVHFTSLKEKNFSRWFVLGCKSKVLPLGLDLEELQNLPVHGRFREKFPFFRNKKIILFLGRINYKKGLDLLLSAFGYLVLKGEDIFLVIAGPDNEGYKKKLISNIRKKELLDRIFFTGMLRGKYKLSCLVDCDIFVLPSYSENLGFAALEALACGKPVIISNRVGIHDKIEEYKAGIVINPEIKCLIHAIKYLLDFPEMGIVFGKNGQQLIKKEFDLRQNTKSLLEDFESIAKETMVS